MRTTGKITHWHPEKAYGFITPDTGAKRVFVHINAFSNRQLQPKVDELVTFTLSTDKQGRPCAAQVTRMGEKPQRVTRRETSPSSKGRAALVLLAVIVAGSYTWSKYYQSSAGSYTPAPALTRPYKETPSQFRCDGRQHCSQMTSCDEAEFFIKNCPITKMDGDGDGIPCESQWCN